MATLGTLKTRILNKYKGSESSSFALKVVDAINDAIEFYQHEDFWFREATANITLVTSVSNIRTNGSFPTDYAFLSSGSPIIIKQSTLTYRLERISLKEYDMINQETTGRPEFFNENAGEINLYPIPFEAYPCEIRYIKKYSAMTNDADSNDWTVNAPQLIEAHALSDLFLSQGHDGETMHRFWADKANGYLMALRLQNKRRQATGNLEIC